MTTQTEQKYSISIEYLQLEEAAEYPSEYRNGEIIKMEEETTRHNEITGSICVYLKPLLRKIN